MSATARAAAPTLDRAPSPVARRTTSRPATARPMTRTAARPVDPAGRTTQRPDAARAPRAGRGVFTLVMCGVLAAGLLVLLVVNTTLAQGAFALDELSKRMTALTEREQALQQELAAVQTPRGLEQRARALGMVRSPNPVFLRLSDSRVLGTPVPAPWPAAPAPVRNPRVIVAGGPDALAAAIAAAEARAAAEAAAAEAAAEAAAAEAAAAEAAAEAAAAEDAAAQQIADGEPVAEAADEGPGRGQRR